MTIGILEDNPGLCHALQTILTVAGYEVFASTDSAAFVGLFKHENIDDVKCIVVDFHLEGKKNGVEVITQVRETYPYLPALLISGDPLSQDALQSLSYVAFCRKPFHSSTLLAAVSQLQDTKMSMNNGK